MKLTLIFAISILLLAKNAQAIVVPITDSVNKPSIQIQDSAINKTVAQIRLKQSKFSEKLTIFLLKKKIISPKKLQKLANIGDTEKAEKHGKRSLLFGILGWSTTILSALLTYFGAAGAAAVTATAAVSAMAILSGLLSVFGFVAAILAIVWGIMSLSNKKKNNSNAVIGLVLGGSYILLALVGLAILLAIGFSIG